MLALTAPTSFPQISTPPSKATQSDLSINRQTLREELTAYESAPIGKSFTVTPKERLAEISNTAFFSGQNYHVHHRKVEQHLVKLLTVASPWLRPHDIPLIKGVYKRLLAAGSQPSQIKPFFDPLIENLSKGRLKEYQLVESKESSHNRYNAQLFVDVTRKCDMHKLTSAIESVPLNDRQHILQVVFPCIATMPVLTRAAVIQALALFSKEQRKEVLDALISLVSQIESENEIDEILHQLETIKSNQRRRYVFAVSPFVNELQTGYQRAFFLASCDMILLLDLKPSVPRILVLFEGASQDQCKAIYEALGKISKNRRGTNIASIAKLIKDIEPGDTRYKAFTIAHELFQKVNLKDSTQLSLRKIPPAKRMEIILLVQAMLQDRNDVFNLTWILNIVNLVPQEKMTEAFAWTREILREITKQESQKFVVEQLKMTKQSSRLKLIGLVNFHIYGFEDGYELGIFINILRLIPEENLSDQLVGSIAQFLKTGSPKKNKLLVNTLILIDPVFRHSVCDMFIRQRLWNRNFKDILKKIFRSDVIKNASLEFIKNKFDKMQVSPKLKPEKMHAFASDVINNMTAFGLNDRHPIIQKAISAQIMSDPNDKDNPYFFWKNLKRTVAKEKEVAEPKLEGSVSLTSLRGWKREKQATGKDLPANTQLENLAALFEQLIQRIHGLDKPEYSKLRKFMLEEFSQVSEREKYSLVELVTILRNNLLQKPMFPSLLKEKYADDAPVTKHVYNAHVVVKFFYDQSNTLEQGQLLSHRELSLLKFSSLIMKCAIDQLEGLTVWCNMDQMKPYRLSQDEQVRRLESSPIDACIDRAFPDFEQSITNALQDPRFINILLGNSPTTHLKQEVHQILFLKNRLCKQLKLNHQVTFDPHKGCVYNELILLDTQTILTKFLAHLAGKFVEALRKEINDSVTTKKIGFGQLSDYFMANGILKEEEDWSSYIVLDEESAEFKELTPKGAQAILQHVGFINKDEQKPVEKRTRTCCVF